MNELLLILRDQLETKREQLIQDGIDHEEDSTYEMGVEDGWDHGLSFAIAAVERFMGDD